MADMTTGQMRAYRDTTSAPALGAQLGKITQYTGAIVSVALLIGMTVWGYRLVVRDVSGLPVVHAAAGPMREAPLDPGGNLGLNTGLAVNAIAALGQAEEPEGRLLLAPAAPGLTEEDLLVQPTAEAGEAELMDMATGPNLAPVEPLPTVEPIAMRADQPMTADDILALADQIAAGAAPLSALAPGDDVPVAVSLEGGAAIVPISADIPGVVRALRPLTRPSGLVVTASAPVAAAPVAPVEPALPVATVIPAGATLVQLGAYESEAIAAAEWARLSGRFGEFMVGKSPVVQEAESSGQRFYRLRALGFADFEDAGRFCSALVAEGALCIPVAGN